MESSFLPPAVLVPALRRPRLIDDTGLPFRGVVHDPTARYMGGVAGHARPVHHRRTTCRATRRCG